MAKDGADGLFGTGNAVAGRGGERAGVLEAGLDEKELEEVYAYSRSHSRNGIVMVEEFMTGPEGGCQFHHLWPLWRDLNFRVGRPVLQPDCPDCLQSHLPYKEGALCSGWTRKGGRKEERRARASARISNPLLSPWC